MQQTATRVPGKAISLGDLVFVALMIPNSWRGAYADKCFKFDPVDACREMMTTLHCYFCLWFTGRSSITDGLSAGIPLKYCRRIS